MWIRRDAIALMITLFFVIAITLSIGITMKLINDAKAELESENFLLQTTVVLDDVMQMLRGAPEIKAILDDSSGLAFDLFLAQSSFIPFEIGDISVAVSLSSARSKINPNMFRDANSSLVDEKQLSALNEFLSFYMVNVAFSDILLDGMRGVRTDGLYMSELFYDYPELFRDYVASFEHFEKLKRFFAYSYNDNSLQNIDFEELFYFSKESQYRIDINQATPLAWEMMLGVDRSRAEQLSLESGAYAMSDLSFLSDSERAQLAHFNTSHFEPCLSVEVEIITLQKSTTIRFEYDMKTKKGTNFVYEI